MAENDTGKPFESIWSDLQGVAFDQGYVNAGGVETRYLHAGSPDKPGLIFLHGTGGHAEAYVRNLGPHSAHFNTYAIDMLGHGYTAKPDYDYEIPRYIDHLLAFIDAVGIDKVSLSGESLGGWVAGAFAVAHPDRVNRLVLNTAGADKVRPEALASLRASTQESVDDPSWERVRKRLEWLMFDPADVHDDLVASRQRIYRAPTMKEGIKRILCLHTIDARKRFAVKPEEWAEIKAPTLVLWTTHDPTAAVNVGEELAAAIPGSKFAVMKDCGHWPQFEDAETFNRIHIEFLLGRD
jgi:2-hydroxy-6-oxonona-2,4-dienedioate hydrolase